MTEETLAQPNAKMGGRSGASLPTWILCVGAVALAVLTFAVFGKTLGHPLLHWDDDVFIRDNPAIRSFGWAQLHWMFSDFHFGHYHPLTWLSYSLDYQLGAGRPAVFFLTNVLLHVVNGVLLWRVCSLLRPYLQPEASTPQWTVAAWISVVLFLVHPCRVEVVAWASERKELLAGVFLMLSVVAYLRAHQTGKRHWMLVSGVWFWLSILSKATGALLPVGLCLLDVAVLGRGSSKTLETWQRLAAEKWLHWSATLAAIVFAPLAQSASGAAVGFSTLSIADRLGQMAYSILYYPRAMLWPASLSPLHLIDPGMHPLQPKFLLSALALAAVGMCAWRLRRRFPKTAAAFAGYLLFILPVSGLAQSGMQLVADRYTYAPAMLAAVCMTALLTMFWQKCSPAQQRWSLAVLLIVGVVSSWRTAGEVDVWSSDETLWARALEVEPDNFVAWCSLGSARLQRGEKDAALQAYERAFELNVAYPMAAVNLGSLLAEVGEADRAEAVYRASLEFNPTEPRLLCNLAVLLDSKGPTQQALSLCEQAIRHSGRLAVPEQWRVREAYARLLLRSGQAGESAKESLRLADGYLAAGEDALAVKAVRNACIATRFRDSHCLQVAAAVAERTGDAKMKYECEVLLQRLSKPVLVQQSTPTHR